ncbi:hypothetical protein [Streptomyces sp. NPDC086023]|uniref:hypothetical protein n=1 Tax=Streptomyces sp. NPDC086023 TaxID=3365746 RepID=UPI0037D3208C
MAVKKATIQQQVAAAITEANPADKPLVTIQAVAGPSVWLMSMLGVIGQAFLTYYFITVTEQAVLVHKASMLSNRPKELAFAIPRTEATWLVSDVNRNTLWSWFRFQLPGQATPARMNVHRIWREELDQLLDHIVGQPVT